MKARRSGQKAGRRPRLRSGLSWTDFTRYYWWKLELIEFARSLGLPAHGDKPALTARIERRLRGLPEVPESRRGGPKGPRDSARPLRRDTRVLHYASDARTRKFFESQIGSKFHFTYHLNQFRLARRNLTYGDLVDEWLAEQDRRRDPRYVAKIADHGKYNRYIRDFFADGRNEGKSLREASAAWNAIKFRPGDPRYRRTSRSN